MSKEFDSLEVNQQDRQEKIESKLFSSKEISKLETKSRLDDRNLYKSYEEQDQEYAEEHLKQIQKKGVQNEFEYPKFIREDLVDHQYIPNVNDESQGKTHERQ